MSGSERLGVLYEPASVQALHLVEAAAGSWETVWLVDRTIADPGPMVRLLARLGEVVDITGLDDLAAAAAPRRPLDGVIAFDDAFLRRCAGIAARSGFATYTPDVAMRLTDKELQRDAFRRAGIPTPGSARLVASGSLGTWQEAVSQLEGPLVVKPVSANGSRDVFAVEDARAAAALMASRVRDGSDMDMVAEERISDGWAPGERPYGDFVTVETFASGGSLRTFGVTGCMPLAEGFRLTGNFMPNAFDAKERAEAVALAERAVTALGGGAGVYHTEIKFSADGPRVVEVNGRLGGGGVPRIAALVTDRSLLRDAGLIALGQTVDVVGSAFRGVGYFHRVQPPLSASRVLSVDGLEVVRRMPGVKEVDLNRRPGESLGESTQGTRGFVYSVFGAVDTHDELWETIDTIVRTVEVTYR